MPNYLDNSLEASAARGQENPFANPVAATGDNPFADTDSKAQDNPFADSAPAIKDNPFGDPVDSGSILGDDQSDVPLGRSNGILGENGDHQTATGFDLPISNLDQETSEVVGKEPATSAASGFDWINPAYLLAMIPVLLIFMAWRWMVEDSEFGDSRSRSKSKSKSGSRSSSSSRSKYDSIHPKTSSTKLAVDDDPENTTGIFRKAEIPIRPKLEVSQTNSQTEEELRFDTQAKLAEDDLLFGKDKETEFDRISAAGSAVGESYDRNDRESTLTDQGSELLLSLKSMRLEKKELGLLLDSMRSQLDLTIRLQQQHESEGKSGLREQPELKGLEKGLMQRLLKSTTGGTESNTITTLVTEFQRQLDSTKVERQKLRELLDASELETETVSAQRGELQRQLEVYEREKNDLQERIKTADTAAESAKMQLEVFQQQLESTKEEKTEIKELLRSTAGATETISTLVVELQQQLESTKLEKSELQGLLQISEDSQASASQQVVDLQKQLDQNAKTIKSLELQVARAASAPRVNSTGSLVNGTGESNSAYSDDDPVGPAVRRKFTKLYRAYERERNLRKESQEQLAKTEELLAEQQQTPDPQG